MKKIGRRGDRKVATKVANDPQLSPTFLTNHLCSLFGLKTQQDYSQPSTPRNSDSDRQHYYTIVRNLFVSIYFFSLRTLFFPRTLILLTHVLTFAMISPHVLSPLFHFAFTIHTKSEPLRTLAKLIRRSSKDRSYLLARLFARHLLPSDPISQGFADRQPRCPLLHELVMRLYITRN